MKITVDDSAAFDALSILFVKMEKGNDSVKNKSARLADSLSEEIIGQIGSLKFYQVLQSREFQNLKNCNSDTFFWVDEAAKADKDSVMRKAYDSNIDRYNAKVILQSRFFKDPILETKTH